MNLEHFISKWQKSTLKERSASQEHFLDLCHLLEHPTPAEADHDQAIQLAHRAAHITR